MNTAEMTVPDPNVVATALGIGLGWGPLNCGTAVRANFCCEYCDRSLMASLDDYYAWEVDHIVPGGPNSLENYALACHTCNHVKHHYVPVGETREERVQDARREVQVRRQIKQDELDRLRQILGECHMDSVAVEPSGLKSGSAGA